MDDTDRNDVGSGGTVAASEEPKDDVHRDEDSNYERDEREAIQAEPVSPSDAPKRKRGGKGSQANNLRSVEGGKQKTGALKRGDHAELGGMLLEYLRRTNSGLAVYDENDFYVYDEKTGLWRVIKKAELSRIVLRWQGRPVDGYKNGLHVNTSTIDGAIDVASRMADHPGFFANAPAGIAFRNGFVAVEPKGLVLRGHVPDNRARWGHPFDYNPDLDCPLFKAFLDQMFVANVDKGELIACLQEWIGIALIGQGAKFGKALIIHAPKGRNGKGVLADIMTAIMPEGAVSASTPDTWSHEYYIADLRGKLLNIVPEMDFRDISDAKRVKAIIVGDQVQGRPIRKEIVKFKPIASHYWTTQEVPGTPDNSYAFRERFIMFHLPDTIAREKRNPNLAVEIIAAEKQAIAAWALAGAARALARGSYAIPASSDMLVDKWLATADSLSWFIHEHCVTLTDDVPREQWLTAEEFGEAYREIAAKDGFKGLYNARNIREKMEAMGLHQKRGGRGKLYPVRKRGFTEPYPDDGTDE